MRKYSILFTFFVIILSACSIRSTVTEFYPKEKFPQGWFGTWKGKLKIYSPQGQTQTVPMELTIGNSSESGSYQWTIIYNDDKKAARKYELKEIDKEKGFYAIDEKNSIEIESYLFHNRLISRFEVNGTLLTCTYEKKGNKIVFEVIAGSENEVSTTGGETLEGKQIPLVKTFPIVTSQRGVLSWQ